MNKALENLQYNLDAYAGFETPYGHEGIVYEVTMDNNDVKVYQYIFSFGDIISRDEIKRKSEPKLVFTIHSYGTIEFNPDYTVQAPVIKFINNYLESRNKYHRYNKFLKHPVITLEQGLSVYDEEVEQADDGVWRYKHLRKDNNIANLTINLAKLPKDLAESLPNGANEVELTELPGKYYIFGIRFQPDGSC